MKVYGKNWLKNWSINITKMKIFINIKIISRIEREILLNSNKKRNKNENVM